MKKTLAVAALMSVAFAGAAQARDQIRIVGSSTVFPFATAVAEEFGKTTFGYFISADIGPDPSLGFTWGLFRATLEKTGSQRAAHRRARAISHIRSKT